jgi:small-conductance mechanosensitive channel
VGAQEPEPSEGVSAAETLLEPAGAEVAIGEITGRAKLVADRLRALERELSNEDLEARLQTELVELAEEIEPRVPEVGVVVASVPSLATLDALRSEWTGFEGQLDAREERLERRVAFLAREIEGLSRTQRLWSQTVDRARSREAPASIVDSAESALSGIERVIGSTQSSLNGVLILQGQYAELGWTVRDTLELVDATRKRVLANILVRDQEPLWAIGVGIADGEGGPGELRRWFREVGTGLRRHVEQHPDRMVFHLMAFLALIWLLRRTREAVEKREAERGDADRGESQATAALLTTRHPIAAAAVIALLAAPFFQGTAQGALAAGTRLVLIAPLIFVLGPLLGAGLRMPLYFLSAFFVADRLRELIEHTLLARQIFLLEMAVATLLMAFLLRSARLEKLPDSARAQRWLAVVGVWVRIAAAGAGFALFAGAAGYMRVASLLGDAVLGSAYVALATYAAVRILESLAAAAFQGDVFDGLRMVRRHRESFERRSATLLRLAGVAVWIWAVLGMLALRDPVGDALAASLSQEIGYGAFKFTLGGFAAFAITILGAWFVSRAIHFVLDEEVYPRVSLPRGVPFALSTLARYSVLLIGFLLAVSALGFDLDRITILLGAFGVGIGFGLQNVVNNFVSGLILLFERPVKVGDRVELAELEGEVRRIGIRASTVRTWDGADVIVPNASLISDRVVNWTFADRLRRIIVPVGVAYGTDPHQVIRVLEGVVEGHEQICAEPEPVVLFMGFGESSLDFQLRVWTDKAETFVNVRSDIALAAHDAIVAAGFEIPFPQRDLHLRSVDDRAASAIAPTPGGGGESGKSF